MNTRTTSFHDLYVKYAADVFRFAFWLSGNRDDAEDTTSETFVRAWTSANEPGPHSVKAFLFAIARNLIRKQWRQASRFEPLIDGFFDSETPPDQAATQRDELRKTMQALQTLSEIDRTLLLLRAESELSYEDIAAVTGLSVTAAKVKVFRARAKLAAILDPQSGENL